MTKLTIKNPIVADSVQRSHPVMKKAVAFAAFFGALVVSPEFIYTCTPIPLAFTIR